MLTASLRRSAFSCPGKRRHVVTPDIVIDTAIKSTLSSSTLQSNVLFEIEKVRFHQLKRKQTEMIEISVRRVGELERAEADVVQSFVVDAERLIRVLNELVHRQRGVVRLDDRVRYLRGKEM